MLRPTILVLLCLPLFPCMIYAQEDTEKPQGTNFKHHIGIGAGFTTGYGISYRYVSNKMGFQVNFAPYIADHGDRVTMSAGLTLLRRIVENRTNNFYVYLANAYFYHKEPGGMYNTFDIDDSWNTGLGVGFEVDTRKRVVLDIMTGFAQYNTFDAFTFTGELALYYRF